MNELYTTLVIIGVIGLGFGISAWIIDVVDRTFNEIEFPLEAMRRRTRRKKQTKRT